MAHRTRGLAAPLLAVTASCVLGPAPVVAPNVADGGYCVSQHAIDLPRGHAPSAGGEQHLASEAAQR